LGTHADFHSAFVASRSRRRGLGKRTAFESPSLHRAGHTDRQRLFQEPHAYAESRGPSLLNRGLLTGKAVWAEHPEAETSISNKRMRMIPEESEKPRRN
jgi:hypothetical protein